MRHAHTVVTVHDEFLGVDDHLQAEVENWFTMSIVLASLSLPFIFVLHFL